MRRHIAGTPGIFVVSPDTTNVTSLFKDYEIVYACLHQRDCHTQATETRPDYHNLFFYWGLRHLKNQKLRGRCLKIWKFVTKSMLRYHSSHSIKYFQRGTDPFSIKNVNIGISSAGCSFCEAHTVPVAKTCRSCLCTTAGGQVDPLATVVVSNGSAILAHMQVMATWGVVQCLCACRPCLRAARLQLAIRSQFPSFTPLQILLLSIY